jgi:hypothetical protein
MKKKYIFICLSLLGSLAFSNNIEAQITITSSDLPSAGTKFIYGFDTTATSISKLTPGGSGASVTWNYSPPSVMASYVDTNAFVTPSATPYGAAYPFATVADTVYGSVGYTYFDINATTFSVTGIVQKLYGYTAGAAFTPPFRQLKLPANYGDTMSGNSIGQVLPFAIKYTGFDSAKGTLDVSYTDSIDAYGSITTPFTAFNVLRQKHYELDRDSVFLHSTTSKTWVFFQAQKSKTYEYFWFAKGVGDIVAILKMDTTNKKVTSFEWYYGTPNGINELNQQHNTLVYPNPCANQINFVYSKQNAQYVIVYDLTGRIFAQTEIRNGTAFLNTSGYATSMYIFHITDKAGNVLDNGKFTVLQ